MRPPEYCNYTYDNICEYPVIKEMGLCRSCPHFGSDTYVPGLED